MITDIHSHILPDIDDGAEDIEESLAMAEIAVAEGIGGIICTPHALRGYEEIIGEAEEARRTLREALGKRNIPLKLYSGFEVYIAEQFLDYESPEKLTLAGGQNILIETDFDRVPECMEEALHLIRVSGLRPVLAHPERYLYLKKDFALCEMWKENGMLFQINAGSLTGLYGSAAQKMARKLLKKGFADFIGTDAHSAGRRAPRIQEAIRAGEKICKGNGMRKILEHNINLITNIEAEEE